MRLSVTITETVTPTLSFAEALEQLWIAKHTGPVILHMQHGRPRLIEIPSEPVRMVLDSATG